MSARNIKRIAGIAVLAVMVFLIARLGLLEGLEYRVQDAVFQKAGLPYHNIAIFAIDEEALETFGLWPWPRHVLAEAINILNSYPDERPAVIAIDVVFSDYDRFSPENDEALAAAVRDAGNVVMASHVELGLDRDVLTLEPAVVRYLTPISHVLPYVRHGLVNAIRGRDGVIRDALLWERILGERVVSFPVAAAQMYMGTDELHPFIQDNASMFLRYTGYPGRQGFHGDFYYGSVAEIFEDWFDPGWHAGSIILIGPYAIGMMDHYPVPIYGGNNMHGVEIHANTIQAILEEAFFLRMAPGAATVLLVLVMLFAMFLGEFLDYRIMLGILAVVGTAYFFVARAVYDNMYIVMPILTPIAALVIIAAYQTVYEIVLQNIEKSRLKSTFKKYVDPKLVDSLIKSGEANSNEVGKKKHIAVIFVDVRGFTPMTESFRDRPEIVVDTLNKYLTLTSDSVFKNGGSVDKFIGDATMALFNGFVPLEDHVYQAVKAAWDMVQGAGEVNAQIKAEHGIDIGFGVGVHCGDAIVGNLGSPHRKDYTAIGDTVNTAARLESNAKRSQVLISKEVRDLLQDRIQADPLGAIPLKGKAVPMEVYALTGVGAENIT